MHAATRAQKSSIAVAIITSAFFSTARPSFADPSGAISYVFTEVGSLSMDSRYDEVLTGWSLSAGGERGNFHFGAALGKADFLSTRSLWIGRHNPLSDKVSGYAQIGFSDTDATDYSRMVQDSGSAMVGGLGLRSVLLGNRLELEAAVAISRTSTGDPLEARLGLGLRFFLSQLAYIGIDLAGNDNDIDEARQIVLGISFKPN